VLACVAWMAARPRDRWYFLLVGAAVLLAWNPYALLDPGFQLSFAAVAAIFAPVLLGLRVGRPAFELSSRVARLVPRTHFLLDIGLDFARRRPGPSVAVLEGLLLGETAPGREQRRHIAQPALVVGHGGDPLHPFSDSGMLVEELPAARLVQAGSIVEWRLAPKRLTEELAGFLDEVWAPGGSPPGSNGNGRRATAVAG